MIIGYDLIGIVLLFFVLFAVVVTAAVTGGTMKAYLKKDCLKTLRKQLELQIDGEGLKGAREGVLVVLRPVPHHSDELHCSISLLDPKGPGQLDFYREGTGAARGASGPDVEVGDADFDDAVHVCAADAVHAVAALPPSARLAISAGIGKGWHRKNAEWKLDFVAVVPELVEMELQRGLRLCGALRMGRGSAYDRLQLRMSDPHAGVVRVATHLMFDRGWFESDELHGLMQHADPSIVVRAASLSGPEGHAWLLQMLSSGSREARVLAAVEVALMKEGEVPASVEPLLLGGLDSELHDRCIEALGRVGGAAAVDGLTGRPGTSKALARIATRRAESAGAVSIVHVIGGEVSVVGPADD